MLVGQKQDPLVLGQGPLKGGRGVVGGADDAAVAAAQRLDGRLKSSAAAPSGALEPLTKYRNSPSTRFCI